jgi:hypothetical protein
MTAVSLAKPKPFEGQLSFGDQSVPVNVTIGVDAGRPHI